MTEQNSETTITPLEVDQNSPNSNQQDNVFGKSTMIQAGVNLYKCCIGSGILAAPYTFYKGGYILTSFCYFFICLLMIYSQLMLLRVAEEINKPNLGFSDLTKIILGKNYVYLNQLFVILMQWGCCASYLLFFMEFFEYAIYHHAEKVFEHQLVYLAGALIMIVPFVLCDKMEDFTYGSIIANSLIVISLIACLVYFSNELAVEVNYNDIPIARFENLPLVIGVALFSFEAIGTLLEVRKSMREPFKFPKLMTFVFTGCIMQFWIFGLLGSLGYGDTTNEIILFSLGKGAEVFQIFYGLALVFTVPLQLIPAFQLIEKMKIFKQCLNNQNSNCLYILKRTLLRLLQVLAIAGLAIGIPQFALLISFIGGLCGAVLQFYFPLMFYLRWEWKERPTDTEGWVYTSLMILGCLLGLVAVANSIYEIAVY